MLQLNFRVIPMLLPRVGFVRWFNFRFVLESVLFPCLSSDPDRDNNSLLKLPGQQPGQVP